LGKAIDYISGKIKYGLACATIASAAIMPMQINAATQEINAGYRSEGKTAKAGYTVYNAEKARANANVAYNESQGVMFGVGGNANGTYLGIGASGNIGQNVFNGNANVFARDSAKTRKIGFSYGGGKESTSDNGIDSKVQTQEIGAGAEIKPTKKSTLSLDYQNTKSKSDISGTIIAPTTTKSNANTAVGAYQLDLEGVLQNFTGLGIFNHTNTNGNINRTATLMGIGTEGAGRIMLVNGLGYEFYNKEINYLANMIIGPESQQQAKDETKNTVKETSGNKTMDEEAIAREQRQENGYLLNSIISVSGTHSEDKNKTKAKVRVNFGNLGNIPVILIGPEVFYEVTNMKLPGTNNQLSTTKVGGGLEILLKKGWSFDGEAYNLSRQGGQNEAHFGIGFRKKF
jgi:hypothetical protein